MTIYVTVESCQGVIAEVHAFLSQESAALKDIVRAILAPWRRRVPTIDYDPQPDSVCSDFDKKLW